MHTPRNAQSGQQSRHNHSGMQQLPCFPGMSFIRRLIPCQPCRTPHEPRPVTIATLPVRASVRTHSGIQPPRTLTPIVLSIGEPKHATPAFITEEVITHLHGLSQYPTTRGVAPLREAISAWLMSRFRLPAGSIDPERHVLPVNGTREALFAFAQCLIDRSSNPLVVMPNPFYQIYEGAALLGGAQPWFLNTTAASRLPAGLRCRPRRDLVTLPAALPLQPGKPDRRRDGYPRAAGPAGTRRPA